ncbi:hypothetical protein U8D42_06605 [Mycobacterium europaeum]|uniref:Uncharacterized protein n=1 Tax=Mycobacterium europaeum TaxID=761804 RepID=A0A0U1DLF0_9MYCO|nr:hypothetical protein [Mycobacterium europaeum]MEA1162277.1 hypothetical protein [Mycobacterium europaeum]CQD17698.1 hypothetical protein BN000_03931 [Mycobacterium europaeum]
METLCRGCAFLAITFAFALGGIDAPAHSVADSTTQQLLPTHAQPPEGTH